MGISCQKVNESEQIAAQNQFDLGSAVVQDDINSTYLSVAADC